MSSPAEAASTKSIFDTYSSQLLVDNYASASITKTLDDFVRAPTKSNKCIKGINGLITAIQGLITAIQVGTVSWDILDDQGHCHTIILPGTYYVPNSPHRLLSPQHWAQTAKDDSPLPNDTWCATYKDCIVLTWQQGRYRRNVPLSKESNVGVFHTAPGIKSFLKACCTTHFPSHH
jgi:hypothetical protein